MLLLCSLLMNMNMNRVCQRFATRCWTHTFKGCEWEVRLSPGHSPQTGSRSGLYPGWVGQKCDSFLPILFAVGRALSQPLRDGLRTCHGFVKRTADGSTFSLASFIRAADPKWGVSTCEG